MKTIQKVVQKGHTRSKSKGRRSWLIERRPCGGSQKLIVQKGAVEEEEPQAILDGQRRLGNACPTAVTSGQEAGPRLSPDVGPGLRSWLKAQRPAMQLSSINRVSNDKAKKTSHWLLLLP